MLTITTTLFQREILANGTVQVVLSKNITNNGEVVAAEAHRFGMVPGSDLAHIKGQVDLHLGEMGYPPISDADWTAISATATAEWTPEIVAAYQAAPA